MRDLSKRIVDLAADKRELLKAFLRQDGVDISSLPIIRRSKGSNALPLSYAQQRMWFLNQLAPNDPFYNLPYAFSMTGSLDVTALEQSFNEVIRRHEILRTTFEAVNGQPVQIIAPTLTLKLHVIDALQELAKDEQALRVQQLAIAEARLPFDLTQGPLLRINLIRLGATEHVLLFTIHHIIADGWSLGVLNREIEILYEAFASATQPRLPELPVQYADFAVWQREWLQGKVLEDQLSYWQQKLNEVSILELPTDAPRPSAQTFRGKMQSVELPQDLSIAIKSLSQGEGVTLFMTLLAAFQVLLHRYTKQDDIVVGSPIANRNRREIEGLIGFFANSVVFRTDLSGNPTFQELLSRVRQVALEASAHQDIPFEILVEKLQIERHPGRNPLFQVVFVLQNAPAGTLKLKGLELRPLELDSGITRFDMEFHLWDRTEGIRGQLVYNTDLFDDSTMTGMLVHFQTLLEGIVANPKERILSLPLSTNNEHQLLFGRVNTQTQYSTDRIDTAGRQVWVEGRLIELSEVEAALVNSPLVEDCVVLARETATSEKVLVAYVISTASAFRQDVAQVLQKQLQAELQAIWPVATLPISYVPMTHLPLTITGQIDEAALTRSEVIDADLVGRWEERLQSVPEVDQVVVVAQVYTKSISSLHLSDLLPHWKDDRLCEGEGGVAQQAYQVTAHDNSELRPLALSDGGPLVIEENVPKTLTDALIQTATKYENKGIIYIQPDGRQVCQTYAALLAEARRILSALYQMGLKPYDRAILQIESLPDYFATFWACVLGGIIPVTVAVPPEYDKKNSIVMKLFNIWRLLEEPPILVTDSLIESLAGLKRVLPMEALEVVSINEPRSRSLSKHTHQSQPDEVVFFQLTSGSTGISKCIQETHHGIICHIHASKQFNDYTPKDVTLNWLSMDHVVPLLMFHIKDVYLGCQQIQVPTQTILTNPLNWLDLIEEYKVTHTWSPNFGYKMVRDALSEVEGKTWDLSSIKFFTNAGEQVTSPVVRDFLSTVAPFGVSSHAMQPAYGMAEVCTAIVYGNNFSLETHVHYLEKSPLHGWLRKADGESALTVNFIDHGAAIPGVQIRIVDKNNQLLSEGMIGYIQVKGEVVTPSYLKNPEANQQAFVGDGWFNTGDLGFILNGGLTITGREKEMIIIRGAHYYCYEIEQVVNEIDGVEPTYVGACGIENPTTGMEELAIFFTPVIDTIEEKIDLIKSIRAQVASGLGVSATYVIPVAKREFPKTTSGKIQRTQLKNMLTAGHFQNALKEIDIQLENANTLPDWFYRKIWRRKELRIGKPANLESGIGTLVFFDRLGLGRLLCDKLGELNQICVNVEAGSDFVRLSADQYRIDPQNPDHYHCLLASCLEANIQVDQVLHLWTYDTYASEISSIEALEHAQVQGICSLLYLTQALVQNESNHSVHLLVISSHSQPTSSADIIAYERTPLLGLIKTISQENPRLDCRHIDLPTNGLEENASYILQELREGHRDAEVAYRNGHRLVPRLEKVDLLQTKELNNAKDRESKREVPFKHGGMYLLSGGLGGIGVEIAKYLLKHYRARLLLVGRTPLPEQEAQDMGIAEEGESGEKRLDVISEHVNAYRELQQLGGEIIYEAVDICELDQMRRMVDKAKAHWGCNLDGIIHLAGLLREQLLIEESWETFSSTIRPKVVGTWVLHQLLKDNSHGIFISFSSVNSFFGGLMAGSYAAADCFLERFTHYQRYQKSLQSYCFAWSLWDGVGMSRGYSMKDQTLARGYYAIKPESGIYSFLAGLCSDQPELLVGLDGNNPHIRHYIEEETDHHAQQLCAYFTSQVEPQWNRNKLPKMPRSKASQTVLAKLQTTEIKDRFGTRSRCDFIQIPTLPLTESGEIDRAKLTAMGLEASQSTVERIAPKTDLERTIAIIWREVLHIESVGTHDNFFELGGHSILLVQVHSKLRTALNRDLSIVDLLRYPTINTLANYLGQTQKASPSYQQVYDRAKRQKAALNRRKQFRQKNRMQPSVKTDR